MQALIVSDNEGTADRVRQGLLLHGQECPPGHVMPLAQAANHLPEISPGLMVLVLSPEPERALTALGDLRALTQARVLAVGPTADAKFVLRTLRRGADEYLDESELEEELEASLLRVGTGVFPQAEAGRVLAVLGPSGGSGSSTVAVNLAVVLAREHRRALLIDLKLETGDLATLLDLVPTNSLADLCHSTGQIDRGLFERALVAHPSGVHLLASPRTFADCSRVTPEGVRQALTRGRALFPRVVVDLDHSFREEQTQVLRQADTVLLVLRLDFTSLRNTRRTLEQLEYMGLDLDRVRLVVNRYGQPREVPPAKAEAALGVKIFHRIPDDPKTVNRANNNGAPAVLESPSAKVSRSLTQLALALNGQLKTP